MAVRVTFQKDKTKRTATQETGWSISVRHRARPVEDLRCMLEISMLQLPECQGNVILQWAGFCADRIGALDAPARFNSCGLFVERQINLVEVGRSLGGFLARNRRSRHG
jgi:hypothetical protein